MRHFPKDAFWNRSQNNLRQISFSLIFRLRFSRFGFPFPFAPLSLLSASCVAPHVSGLFCDSEFVHALGEPGDGDSDGDDECDCDCDEDQGPSSDLDRESALLAD